MEGRAPAPSAGGPVVRLRAPCIISKMAKRHSRGFVNGLRLDFSQMHRFIGSGEGHEAGFHRHGDRISEDIRIVFAVLAIWGRGTSSGVTLLGGAFRLGVC